MADPLSAPLPAADADTPAPELIVRRAGEGLHHYPLDRPSMALGNDPEREIFLDGMFVSRRHALIEQRDNAYFLSDTRSRNGTSLNGMRIEPEVPYRLGHLDRIDIGGYVAVFWVRTPGTPIIPEALLSQPLVPPSAASSTTGLRVDAARQELWFNGGRLGARLSAREFTLLSYLYDHRDRLCSKEELGEAVWGIVVIDGKRLAQNDDGMLHVLIHNTKAKLAQADPRLARAVVNRPGRGYRLDTQPAEDVSGR